MISLVWISHTPEHHCRVSQGVSINDSIPRDSNGKLSQCLKYVNLSLSNQTMACNDGWTYDPHDSYTIVNQWDLVCVNRMWNQLSQTILVVGVMFGAFIFSVLSDKFGRKLVFLGCHVLMVLVGMACALVTNFGVFIVLRFITGMLEQGILLCGFVLVSELFSMKQRAFAGIINMAFWGLGVALIAYFAYIIPHWSQLQLAISVTGIFILPLFWFMPESVPWLYANGRVEEAEKIVRKAARFNKIEMPQVIFKMKNIVENETEKDENQEGSDNLNGRSKIFVAKIKPPGEQFDSSYTLLDFIKSRKLMTFLGISSFAWISITLVFYGLTFAPDGLQGNRFLNGFISGIIEVPACIVTSFLLHRFGRKRPFLGLLVLAGIFVLSMCFFPPKTTIDSYLVYIPVLLSTVGKFCITGCFAILFLYVSELFPTNLRNQALGITSFFGRLGNLLATFTLYIVEIYPAVPSLLFACMSFLTAISVLFLPETHNRPLPQTIKEIESWTRTVYIKSSKDKDTPLHEKADDPQIEEL